MSPRRDYRRFAGGRQWFANALVGIEGFVDQ